MKQNGFDRIQSDIQKMRRKFRHLKRRVGVFNKMMVPVQGIDFRGIIEGQMVRFYDGDFWIASMKEAHMYVNAVGFARYC